MEGYTIKNIGVILQVVALSVAMIGGYVALQREVAGLTAKVESLQRNADGMEHYLMDLYRER